MQHYSNSNYALNKHSEGIVYRFADCIVEVTLTDYLADNPSKTETDFLALKEFSDTDYHEEDKSTYRETWKDMPFTDAADSLFNSAASAEDSFFGDIEVHAEDERYQEQINNARHALDKLTTIQRKRYLMYYVDGLTMRQIADLEGVGHTKIQKSIEGAVKKIKKVLSRK